MVPELTVFFQLYPGDFVIFVVPHEKIFFFKFFLISDWRHGKNIINQNIYTYEYLVF